MRKDAFITIVITALALFGGRGIAAEKADAKSELKELVAKIQDKLNQGKRAEKDFADDLKQFDALLEKRKSEQTDEVAEIAFMKAALYLQVFDHSEKSLELFRQLKTDFPETARGKQANEIIGDIQEQAEGKKVQSALIVGAKFPDFDEKDQAGHPLSIAHYKGKVVLIDFWATWCGPCVGELPNVLKTYEKHHDKGFEIVGISLDKDEEALKRFVQNRGVAWPQYFDGKGWKSKLAVKYGIQSIPATYLLDAEGKIAARDLRGEALEAEVAKMLAKP